MFKVLVLANDETTIYNFRRELLKRLISDNFKVYVCFPQGSEKTQAIADMGCELVDISIERKGKNPIKDIGIIAEYRRILKKYNPDIVFTYTVKPNIYGGIACARLGVPYVANITGLGVISNRGFMQTLLLKMQKYAFRKAQKVFFQNEDNYILYKNKEIINQQGSIIPGSGVNLQLHRFESYPENGRVIRFITVSRIVEKKGYDELFEAAQIIKSKYDNVEFHVIGWYESDKYKRIIEKLEKQNVIIYHGSQPQETVHELVAQSDCLIHASYYPEGMSNVLLEAQACGRPVITTNHTGCRDTMEDGKTGILIEAASVDDLVNGIERFLGMEYIDRVSMGKRARKMMEERFDRQIVVDAYMKEINAIDKNKQ